MKRWNLRTKYGVYDRYDDCWIGSNEDGSGPRLSDSTVEAYFLARIAGIQFCQLARFEVRQFPGTETVEFLDEIGEPMSIAEAARKLEREHHIKHLKQDLSELTGKQ